MTSTFNFIEKKTVGSAGSGSIVFSSIPQTYTDLLILASVRTNRTSAVNDYLNIAFNGDTTNGNYVGRFFYSSGSGNGAYTHASASAPRHLGDVSASGATSNIFSVTKVRIPDYASTTRNKLYSAESTSENNAQSAILTLDAGKWTSNSAITSITIAPGVGSLLVEFSTFYLYGISKE